MLLFHVVVSSGHTNNDCHGEVDGHTLDHAVGEAVLDQTDTESRGRGEEQDAEDLVLELLSDQLQETLDSSKSRGVGAKAILAVLDILGGTFNSILKVDCVQIKAELFLIRLKKIRKALILNTLNN